MTQFWDHLNAELEIQHAKNMADACKAAGVPHVVWSSLEDTRPVVGDELEKVDGTYPVSAGDNGAVIFCFVEDTRPVVGVELGEG